MHTILEEILAYSQNCSNREEILTRFAYKLETAEFEPLFELLVNNRTLFFFSKPAEKRVFLGVGKLESPFSEKLISAASQSNFDSTGMITTANYNSDSLNDLPLVLGTEKFTADKKEELWEDFDNQCWFIPKVLLVKNPEGIHIIIQFFGKKPDVELIEKVLNELHYKPSAKERLPNDYEILSSTEQSEWTRIVTSALNEISNKSIEKVVLARRIQLKLKNSFGISAALESLQTKYPDCSTFAYKENDSVFFGSTPEKLFILNGNFIETEALAGSAPRGADQNEDMVFSGQLINNQKDIYEHNNVLSFVLSNLEIFSDNISYLSKPQIKKLANIQHLQTPIKATLKDGVDILELLRKLNPTPAICGLPQKKALELIKDLEYFDRGLYAGVIGWFNENRKCEFTVGIRSAILKKNILTAYAGCGIVEGSDPISEYQETELKFKPILSLLENEIINQP